MFLATLIVAMFVCLACIQNRKADKRSLVVGQVGRPETRFQSMTVGMSGYMLQGAQLQVGCAN